MHKSVCCKQIFVHLNFRGWPVLLKYFKNQKYLNNENFPNYSKTHKFVVKDRTPYITTPTWDPAEGH